MLHLRPEPTGRAELGRSVVAFRSVLFVMARSVFQSRFKQARLGIAWSVALPLLQAAVLAVIFSRFVRFETEGSFAAYVLSGMVPFTYLSGSISQGSTSIVARADLATKVWFPRVLLPLVGVVNNLVPYTISLAAVIALLPVLDVSIGPRLIVLVPATVLVVVFAAAAAALLGALDVYFRDVRHLVEAGLLLWFYVTPVLYPTDLFGDAERWFALNPATGALELFRYATLGTPVGATPLAVTLVGVAALCVAALEVHRRHDRLFADMK